MSRDSGTSVPETRMVSKRREDVAERDDLLRYLTRFLPEKKQDSPAELVRFLLELKERRFGGLAPSIPDEDRRRRFEAWVSLGTPASLAKAVQRAFRGRVAQRGAKPETRPRPVPLLWPVGREQRKRDDPTFKESILNPKRGEAGRLFLRSLSASRLYRVEVWMDGERLAAWLSVAPGEFVEIEWRMNPKITRVATYNGWREEILAFEDNERAVQSLRPVVEGGGELRELMQKLSDYGQAQLARVRRIMPQNLASWKTEVHRLPLEIRCTDASETSERKLSGVLSFTMETIWTKFVDDSGFEQPIA
jgi:hypothetical protein